MTEVGSFQASLRCHDRCIGLLKPGHKVADHLSEHGIPVAMMGEQCEGRSCIGGLKPGRHAVGDHRNVHGELPGGAWIT